MLDTYVRQTLLTVLCILEAGMCFKLACLVLKGERILTKMQRTGIVLGTLVVGTGLAYNRNLLLFFAVFLQRSGALQDENKILRVRDELQKQKYQELETQHGESRRIIHDIRNHIALLQGLCENQDLSAVSGYLKEMAGMFSSKVSKEWTGDDVLNIILNQKMQEAQASGIEMSIQSGGVLQMPFQESETVSLFGNLLDNAIEACRKVESRERLIQVRIDQKPDMIYVKIVNSVEEEPVIKNGSIMTTKKDKRTHGYGLKNIRRIVEKYDGVMAMETIEYKFYIYISFL